MNQAPLDLGSAARAEPPAGDVVPRGRASLGRHLALLALGLVVPTLAFVGVLLWQYAASERARVEEQARGLARNLSVALDRELVGVQSALQALATSPSLRGGDLAAFHGQASETRRSPGVHFSLRNGEGVTLLTTRAPFGTRVDASANLQEADREALRTGRFAVSDIYIGSVSGRPAFQVVVPVAVGGAPAFLLGASLDTDFVADALKREGVPAGWAAAAVDRKGIVVARTERHEDYTGKPASETVRTRVVGEAGLYYGGSVAGVAVLGGFARSPVSGWHVVANTPAELAGAALRRSLLLLLGLGAGLAALATALAFGVWRRIARAVDALREAAGAIGRGEPVRPVETPLPEVDEVGRALAGASAGLRERERERDAAEASLRASEERTRLIIEGAKDTAILTVDPEGRITSWSSGAEAAFGWAARDVVGRSADLLFTPEDRAAGENRRELDTARREGRANDERWHPRKDGGRVFMNGSVHPLHDGRGREVGFLKVARDETARRAQDEALRELNATLERRVAEAVGEREKAEAQLRQAQKMEAVGRLTGGVAHDFNNLLTVVTGNLDMLRRRLDGAGDDRLRRYADNAAEGARRAATLISRLLAFSRQSPLAPEVVDPNKLVAGMSDLLRRTLGENIAIETVLAGGLWRVEADPNGLENALLNLAVNARDAMPEGGKLTVETANAHLDQAYSAATQGEVKAGQYVLLSVSDTGQGIPPEHLNRVFEPFFTTKPVGKGTGLGLAQVYGFAKQSGGHAAVYSEPGHGTTVKLYFPRLKRAVDRVQETVDGHAPAPATVPAKAGETVLVVEDEPMVRDFSATVLEEAGYRVLSAADGPGGLALLDAHPEVALLFTDVVLAGPMNGRKVADEALRRRPGLPVLFTTGYTRNAIIHHGRLDEGVNLLGKPFSAGDLSRRVRDLLDGAGAGAEP